MALGRGTSSELNRRIRIERPKPSTAFAGAGRGTWEKVCEVAANVQDALPSRGEKLADGLNVATRPARVRIRYRRDITPDMRFLLLRWHEGAWAVQRTMQIIAGPAEIGLRDRLEFMVEDYTSAGNAA